MKGNGADVSPHTKWVIIGLVAIGILFCRPALSVLSFDIGFLIVESIDPRADYREVMPILGVEPSFELLLVELAIVLVIALAWVTGLVALSVRQYRARRWQRDTSAEADQPQQGREP